VNVETVPPAQSKERGRRIIIVLIVAVVAMTGVAEAFNYLSPDTSTSGTPYVVTVFIVDGSATNKSLGFSPSTLTLVLGYNNTVQWVNEDATKGAVHTVIFSKVPLDSNITTAGLSSSVTPGIPLDVYYGPVDLPAPGTYVYHCYYDPWMTGTIVVKI